MATANSHSGTGRVGWVEFADEPFGNDVQHQTECLDPPLQHNTWVLFDEKPLPSPTPQAHVKAAARHSICSTASFWSAAPPSENSWTTHSEQSSISMGASSCDLNSVEATSDDPDPTLAQTQNLSVFIEDEGVDMDSISLSPCNRETNGQAETLPVGRLSSWVTFDEEDQRPCRPPHSALDNATLHRFQDGNSNQISPLLWNQNEDQNGGIESHHLNLTPNSSSSPCKRSAPNIDKYKKKNPFFDEDFNDMKPSTINPFSSFFDSRQEMRPQLRSSNRHDITKQDSKCASISLTPLLREPLTKQGPGLQHPAGAEVGGGWKGGSEEVSPTPRLDLGRLRNLQVADPDWSGGLGVAGGLPNEEVEGEEMAGEERGAPLLSPYQPSHMTTQEGWPMLLRIPEKKNIMSSRHWGPIYVRLSDEGLLRLFYERGLEKPFRTLRLDRQHEVSEHRLQNYEEMGRVHTISVELVQYRDKRRIQPKSPITHQPVREQLVKLATVCYHDYLSFRHSLLELLRRLPSSGNSPDSPGLLSPPAVGGGPSEEEIQVEVRDEFYGTVGEGGGSILKQLVVTRVHVLAFLLGLPRCQLGLNDIQVKGKEVVSRHDIIPNTTACWIHLCDPELSKEHTDELEFVSSRGIFFTPPARCRFELLRFRTAFAEKSLPFALRTVASVNGAEVTVQSWLLMSQGFSSNRDPLTLVPCENVMIRYPIPESWAKNFRREGVIGEKSLKARFNKGTSFGTASTSGSEPAMRVTLGSAKYEQAFKAVVWRMNQLPDKNSALSHPHTFFCRLELGSDREVPPSLQRHLEVEFDMPAASASKATVRSLSVGDRADVKKWVNYKSHYSYQVPIEQKREGAADDDHPGQCPQQ